MVRFISAEKLEFRRSWSPLLSATPPPEVRFLTSKGVCASRAAALLNNGCESCSVLLI